MLYVITKLLMFSLLLCTVLAAAEENDTSRRLHSIVSVTPSEGTVKAEPLFTQNIQRVTSTSTNDRNDALIIEIDQLEPIHIVPMCSEYQNFAVTVNDRVLYKCGLRPSGTDPTPILMHLFLENDVLKIAQSQDSLCSDRRRKSRSKKESKSLSTTRWQRQYPWIASRNIS